MKREDCRENYKYFSGTASEIVRQLAFGALAIIWIFKEESLTGAAIVPLKLMLAAQFAVIALSFDLLHYISGAAVWGGYNRYLEKRGYSADREFKAPRVINWPTLFFFWGKIAALVLTYFRIFTFLTGKLYWH